MKAVPSGIGNSKKLETKKETTMIINKFYQILEYCIEKKTHWKKKEKTHVNSAS